MKKYRFLSAALVPSALFLLFTGCTKTEESPPAPANSAQPAARPEPASPPEPPTAAGLPVQPTAPREAVADPVAADPIAEMSAALENATLDKHEGLSAVQLRMDRGIDDQVRARKAAGADVSLAADEKLDDATEVFAEKLRMLTLAGTETWDSAKHDAKLALQQVQAALAEVNHSPPRQ